MHLRELFLKEDDRSTAVFAFGRFNPPTIGHQKLIEKVQSMARQVNGKGFIFLTHTQNNKKDPLSFQEKQAYIRSQITDPNLEIGDPAVKTIIQALQKIKIDMPLVIRLAGTNVEKGNKILKESKIKYIEASTLEDAANKAVVALKKLEN